MKTLSRGKFGYVASISGFTTASISIFLAIRIDSTSDTIWVLGIRKAAEEFTEHMKAIYVGRSKIVLERMSEPE